MTFFCEGKLPQAILLPQKMLWANCFPGRWWIQSPIKKAGKNNIYHRNLSSVAPIFSAKKSSSLEQGGVCFLFVRPEKWDDSQVGFRGSNASGARIVLLPGAFWAHVLPNWPLWAHLFYSPSYSVSELRRACFRQALVARAMLPPSALFRAMAFALTFLRQEKRAQRLTFWVRRPPGGVGVSHAKGWWPKKFVPSLKSLSSLGFEERNLGCPGNFGGMSRTPGRVQKVCAKKVRVHFSFPISVPPKPACARSHIWGFPIFFPANPKLRPWSEFPPPQKLRPWSEFLLSLVNTESGVVWVLVRVFPGPWSEFSPARSETLG